MKILLLLLSFLAAEAIHAQEKKVFISRPKSKHASLIKFRLLVNGRALTLVNHSYAELSFTADSVVVEVADAPGWMKKGSRFVALDSVTYLSVFSLYPGGTKREVISIEKVCRSCYEENKEGARRRVELE